MLQAGHLHASTPMPGAKGTKQQRNGIGTCKTYKTAPMRKSLREVTPTSLATVLANGELPASSYFVKFTLSN